MDRLAAVLPTSDGGCLLGGTSVSSRSGDKSEDSRGLEDYWIVKLDSTGSLQWEKTIGGDRTDRLKAIRAVPGGGFLLLGLSNSGISGEKTAESWNSFDWWIVETDSLGKPVRQQVVGGSDWDEPACMTAGAGGNTLLLGGYSRSGFSADKWADCRGSFDYWLVELEWPSKEN
jgi:hypothetical protein